MQEAHALTRWMDILNQAGDENFGATLIRLAQTAALVHQYEQVAGGQESSLAEGSAVSSVVRPKAPAHMEVDR